MTVTTKPLIQILSFIVYSSCLTYLPTICLFAVSRRREKLQYLHICIMFTTNAYSLFGSCCHYFSYLYCLPFKKDKSTGKIEVVSHFVPMHCFYDFLHIGEEIYKPKINVRDLFLVLLFFQATFIETFVYFGTLDRHDRITKILFDMKQLTTQIEGNILCFSKPAHYFKNKINTFFQV